MLNKVRGFGKLELVRAKNMISWRQNLLETWHVKLQEAGRGWKKAPAVSGRCNDDDDDVTETEDKENKNNRLDMLLWCELFLTTKPSFCQEGWSRALHHRYPWYVQLYVRELLEIGSRISRRSGGTCSGSQDSAVDFKNIWDVSILPFVI